MPMVTDDWTLPLLPYIAPLTDTSLADVSLADMFGGYTEVAAYYVNTPWPETDDEDPGGPEGGLPLDYTPRHSPPDPWHRHAACHSDFVMIAEFSEQEGPKPLIVIPKAGGDEFDLNEFAVRIMSVDFQTLGGSFTMTEDTQLIMSEAQNGIYAYVHHFTLYDYQARGFVRPFCMSYVTPDQNKLWAVFEAMSERFRAVARCFKHGNLGLFVKDMTHYLSDLHYTKERFLERVEALDALTEDDRSCTQTVLDDPEEDALLRSVTLAGIDNLIREVKGILEATSNMLIELGDRGSPFSPPAGISPPQRSLSSPATHQGEPHSADAHLDDNFRYSCSLHSSSPALNKHWETIGRRRVCSAPQGFCNWTEDEDVYKPTVVRTTNKKRFEKALRGLSQLCMWGANEGLDQLQGLYKYFSRETYSIDMEQADVASTVPGCGLLTVGQTVQLNFLDGLQVAKPIHDHDTSCEGNTERKSCSSDTMQSFHSAASFLSCDDVSPDTDQAFSTDAQSPGELTLGGNDTVTSVDSGVSSSCPAVCDYEKWSTDTTLNATTGSKQGSASSLQSNGDESGAFLASLTSDVQKELSVVSSSDHVTNLSQSSPGYGVQRLAQLFPASLCHVLYSLLIGRPVAVFGTVRVEREIRAAVRGLGMFVPGHASPSAVLPWHTDPLTVSDLTRHKLIGLGRPERRKLENMVPSSVKGFVTILDIEKKTVWAPEYQGGLINDITNKRKVLDEPTYIAYIHSIFYELSLKASLYFHLFCVGSQNAAIPQNHSSAGRQPASCQKLRYQTEAKHSLDQLHVTAHDARIVQYFSDIVTSQHLDVLAELQVEGSDLSVGKTRLEYVKCSMFKA